jgi:thioesterase domain-containing protein/acyl carrier protein
MIAIERPKNDVERRLLEIWTSLFGMEEIGTNHNYFELGGDSLLAVRVFKRIEAEFQTRIPMATLFEAPTIELLADFIQRSGSRDARSSDAESSLVAIQPNGSRPAFFCVHGAGGNVVFYLDLARHLGPDQPFYGLQSPGLDGKHAFLTRIEEMAACYVKAVRIRQPKGPYFLGGYCMGGTIALEMAQQLRDEGQEVALLGLMDTLNWANATPNSWRDAFHIYFQKVIFHWKNFLLLKNKDKLRFIRAKLKVLRNRVQIWSSSASFKNVFGKAPQSLDLARLWHTNDRAMLRYVPKAYAGRIVHFRPLEQYAKDDVPEREWDQLAVGGVEKITLPVYPAGMLMEPFVSLLAGKLRDCIDKSMNARAVAGQAGSRGVLK